MVSEESTSGSADSGQAPSSAPSSGTPADDPSDGVKRVDPLTLGLRSFVEAGRLLIARIELLIPTMVATFVVLTCQIAAFVGLFQIEAVTGRFGEGAFRHAGTLTFVVGGAVLVWVSVGNLAMVLFRTEIGARVRTLFATVAAGGNDPADDAEVVARKGVRLDARCVFVAVRGVLLAAALLVAGDRWVEAQPIALAVVGLGWFAIAGFLLLESALVGTGQRSGSWRLRAWDHRRLAGGYLFSHLLLSVIPLTLVLVLPVSAVSGALLDQRLSVQPES